MKKILKIIINYYKINLLNIKKISLKILLIKKDKKAKLFYKDRFNENINS
jgi:hypothetical protein